jgi:hypothetical protein
VVRERSNKLEITKRNHYNPCFWIAFWNPEYFQSALTSSTNLDPREQAVYSLNIKSNKIYSTNVDNVHFDKNIGLAEITFDAAKKFCRQYHPNHYKEFCRNSSAGDYPIFLDLEDILKGLEGLRPYTTLLTVIKNSHIVSVFEQSFLAAFVYIQALRSHAILNSALQWNAKIGLGKFEYIYLLKWSLADRDFLMQQTGPLIFSKWYLYSTAVDSFPLTDSPVLVNPESVMVALSPRLLLEIRLDQPSHELPETKDRIEPAKLNEFRQRTIGNTFREIIFGNKALLEQWQATKEFSQRLETIQRMSDYNIVVARRNGRDLWHLNAYGNQEFHSAPMKPRRRRK